MPPDLLRKQYAFLGKILDPPLQCAGIYLYNEIITQHKIGSKLDSGYTPKAVLGDRG